MTKHTEKPTRDRLIAHGITLCLSKGFAAMSLSELLGSAGVPKGCFYHYFSSKEAFGVAMLEHYYQDYNHTLERYFLGNSEPGAMAVYLWYQNRICKFEQSGFIGQCLGVKLSAEVCDLSEDMRVALTYGAAQVMQQIAKALKQDINTLKEISQQQAEDLAQVVYVLWLGASLQAKLTGKAAPLHLALKHIADLLRLSPLS